VQRHSELEPRSPSALGEADLTVRARGVVPAPGIRALRTKSCFDRTVIRICVIVFAAWIVISVPTVVLFGVLVRAGRRRSRTPLIVTGDGTSVRAISSARSAGGRARTLAARRGLLG